MNIPTVPGRTAGCLYGLGLAVVTGALLFVNGSVVLVFVKALTQSGSTIASRPDVAQFLLLSIPVVLVVVEWKLIDYFWSRFVRRTRT